MLFPPRRPRLAIGLSAPAWVLAAAPAAAGELAIEPDDSFDAGEVRVGESEDFPDADLVNVGSDTLTIEGIDEVGPDCASSFSFTRPDPPPPVVLESGERETITAEVTPSARGPHACDLAIETDESGQPPSEVIEYDAAGVAPAASLSPELEAIDFGGVPVGGESAPETFAIENDDGDFSDDLEASISLQGPDEGAFEATIQGCDDGGCVIPPGGDETVAVEFAPEEAGSAQAELVVAHDDPEEDDFTIDLSGEGLAPAIELVTDSALDYGEIELQDTSAPQTVEIENAGDADLSIEDARLDGSDPDQFAIDDEPEGAPSFTLEPGGDAAWEILCAPTARGDLAAEFVIESDDPDQEILTVSLSCEGVLTAADVPAAIDFGEVAIDEDPEIEALEVENIGDTPFEIVNASVDNTEDFSLDLESGDVPVELAPDGGEFAFDVQAHPETVGQRTATVTITTDIPGNETITVDLIAEGVAPDLVVSQGIIDFGSHDVADPPATRTVIAGNNAGASAPLVIESAEIDGPEVYTLSGDGALPDEFAPGESIDLTVAYDPVTASPGEPSAALVIQSDARAAEIELFGRGIDRAIDVQPQSIVFPETQRNPIQPPREVIAVRNNGEAPLSIEIADLQGQHPEAFVIGGEGLPTTLASGAEIELDVTFNPSVASSSPRRARLALQSDDREHPIFEVALAGQAVIPSLILTPGELDLGSTGVDVPVARSAAIAVENRDDEELVIEDLALAGSDAGAFALGGWDDEPETLEPGASLALDVEFEPGREGDFEAELELYLQDDPERVAVTQLRGEATLFQARGGGCAAGGAAGSAGGGALVLLALWAAFGAGRRRPGARAAA